MGSKLSIINDVGENVRVQVKTVGGWFTVATQIYIPGAHGHFNLGKVWYDVYFTFARSGETRQTTVYMGGDKTIRCSKIPNFAPDEGPNPPIPGEIKALDQIKHILLWPVMQVLGLSTKAMLKARSNKL